MWAVQDTYSLASPPADVWAIYTDVSVWAKWSPDIEWADIDGPYQTGAAGRMQFRGLPPAKWRVLAADEPKTFASEVRNPGLKLSFTHSLVARGPNTDVTERVSFHGPLGWLLGPILKRRWARGWPGAMGSMGELAFERAEARSEATAGA